MTEQQEPEQGAVAERRQDRYLGDVELTHWHTVLGRWFAAFARWLADTVVATPRRSSRSRSARRRRQR